MFFINKSLPAKFCKPSRKHWSAQTKVQKPNYRSERKNHLSVFSALLTHKCVLRLCSQKVTQSLQCESRMLGSRTAVSVAYNLCMSQPDPTQDKRWVDKVYAPGMSWQWCRCECCHSSPHMSMFANNALLGSGVRVRVWIREQRKIKRWSKTLLSLWWQTWTSLHFFTSGSTSNKTTPETLTNSHRSLGMRPRQRLHSACHAKRLCLVLAGVRCISTWLSHFLETVTLCLQGTVVGQ